MITNYTKFSKIFRPYNPYPITKLKTVIVDDPCDDDDDDDYNYKLELDVLYICFIYIENIRVLPIW